MKPTLVQCQLRAIFIGLLWWMPYLIVLRYISDIVFLAFPVFILGFPILIAFFVAVITGPFDLLAVVTCLIPAAYQFLVSTHEDWVWHAHHLGTLIGSSPVLDVLTIAVTFILAAIGIALKRWLVPGTDSELSLEQNRSLWKCLYWDLGVIAAVIMMLLGIDAVKIAHENDPQVFVASRNEILASPTAPESDKLQVIMKLELNRSPEATEIQHQALTCTSSNVRLTAAASLLEKGDISGLAELEASLMQSSTITITNYQQMTHPDWLGYAEGGPISLKFDLARHLGSITNPTAAPILTRLLSSSSPGVRNLSAQALENMHLHDTQPQVKLMR